MGPEGTADATLRRLTPGDAARYVALRRAMLAESPLAFSASPESDRGSDEGAVRESLERGSVATFGAFAPELVGAVTLLRSERAKTAHKLALVAMYVAPGARRRGLGLRLVQAAVAYARELDGVAQLHLSVTDAAPGARALYEQAGFRAWGTEPRSLRHAGRTVDETHMVLFLDG